ncbi:AMP-dependent synthetase/ligase [Avrilella dinanensis]|uniref:AMP-dependent synthetase/ligase n=1 Tax=Avrilella dinanensis TaxID=2008672 RepID=UPI00240A4BDB|nr:long-chain fatty acid--CoA ligase [Avrilella dinanensis]
MTEITRLFDIPYYQQRNYELNKCFTTKYGNEWKSVSTSEYLEQANTVSRALLAMGIKPGDKIAVITDRNRTEWHILDIGILQIGAVSVPIYPTISAEDYQYVLSHSESIMVFVSNQEIYEKLNTVKLNIPKLRAIYSFDEIEGCANWSMVLKAGTEHLNQQQEVFKLMDEVKPEDLASLIYTSGTTGRPKGVMLTHKNIVSNVLGCESRVPFDKGKFTALSFLPCCHIFERMILYLYQYMGVSISFAESIDKIGDNLKEVKPQVMTVVPRVLEKVYDKIYAKGASLSGLKKNIFMWAIKVGEKFEPYQSGFFYNLQLKITRKLVFNKWHEGLGGNLELLVSGSAALQPRLARIFGAAEIPVMEGYGLTETSPVISVNDQRNKGWKIGTVGKVIDNVEVKIADDGEILCKGPSIAQGYYKDEEKTAEAFSDGYFHTGDIGNIDEQGFLSITDRKKEMFKTSGGKYVAPQLLEGELKQSRFIEQIMIVGEGEKMPGALIQPNFDFIKEWATRKNTNIGTTLKDICQNKEVIDRIQQEIDQINPRFGKWEQIKRFKLTPSIWSIETGELTPTLKMKRKIILEKYKDLYEQIYGRS